MKIVYTLRIRIKWGYFPGQHNISLTYSFGVLPWMSDHSSMTGFFLNWNTFIEEPAIGKKNMVALMCSPIVASKFHDAISTFV